MTARPFRPLAGYDVDGFVDDTRVRVRRDGTPRMLVSLLPLRSSIGHGRPAPVDLRVEQDGGAFAPDNPLTPTSISASAEGGVSVGTPAVRFAPEGVVQPAAGRREGGNVFYANARPDTDLLVRPQPAGAETFEILRSAESPEVMVWSIDPPPGAEVRPSGEPGLAAEVVGADGRLVATVTDAVAEAADGVPVEVTTELDGRHLRMTLRHRDADVAYPIVVDPLVTTWGWQCGDTRTGECDTDYTGWTTYTPKPSHFAFAQGAGPYGAGLYINAVSGASYAAGDRAIWEFIAAGTSRITRAWFNNMSHQQDSGSCVYHGIYARGFSSWSSGPAYSCGATELWDYTHTVKGTRGNGAVWGTEVRTSGQRGFVDHAGNIQLELADEDHPRVDVDVPIGWTSAQTIEGTTSDHGLGVRDALPQRDPTDTRLEDCALTRERQRCPVSRTISWSPVEGISQLEGYAEDAAGRATRLGHGVRVRYYDGDSFTGAKLTQVEPRISLRPGSGRPTPSFDADYWSVRWEGEIKPRYSETYTFIVDHDDQAKLWIDGQALHPSGGEWTCCGRHSATIALEAGKRYALKMEVREQGGGAHGELLWRSASQPEEVVPPDRLFPWTTGLRVEHFDESSTAETLPEAAVRYRWPARTIDESWGSGSPDARLAADMFSSRWTGYVVPRYSEAYRFIAQGDDRVRMWLDGSKVIDDWNNYVSPDRYSPWTTLEAGKRYAIRFEHREDTGDASARLLWESASQSQQVVPQSQLLPPVGDSAPPTVKVDRTPPRDITLDGAFRALGGKHLSAATTLTAAAQDGTASVPAAGIASARLFVDDQPADDAMAGTQAVEQPCAQDSCGISANLTLDPSPLAEGKRRARVVMTDHAGNSASSETVAVFVDRAEPAVTLSGQLAAAAGTWVGGDPLPLAITTADAGTGIRSIEVVLDGVPAAYWSQECADGGCGMSRSWTFDPTQVADGQHLVQVHVLDGADRLVTRHLTVSVDRSAPAVGLSGVLARADDGYIGGDSALHVEAADGTGAGVRSVEILLDGVRVDHVEQPCTGGGCSLARDWTLSTTGLSEGPHTVRVVAEDHVGRATAKDIEFDYSTNAPPVAPPLPENEITPFHDQTKFLYDPAGDPIQTGIDPAVIEPRRAAVIRGKVTERDGTPIGGVMATVLGRGDFGRTTTRVDGELYLAVNGGGPLTVRLQKEGYLPVDRQVDVPWQGYAHIEPTVMIGVDPEVTPIETGLGRPMQVHRASVETDANGTRRATLLFPRNLEAWMEMEDGSTRPLSTMNVRATEYTVGDTGQAAMPAPLPPTSAYTYAADFSVDEAREHRAKHVHFGAPVIGYVENFRAAPVGARIPNGYYERSTAQWVPDTDGTVVKIISEQNGVATLELADSTPANNHTAEDTDEAATSEELASLGVTSDELEQLAQLYEPGQELWRVPTRHFSDWNFSFVLFGSIVDPPEWTPEKPTDDPCVASGSVIECDNQILGEDVGVTGSGVGLHYRSDRSPSRTADNYAIDVPLVGATVPEGLRGVDVMVEVAGRRFSWAGENRLAPTANARFRFQWNGKDAFGRTVSGAAKARVRVGYAYNIVYRAADDGAQASADGGAGTFGIPPPGSNVSFFSKTIWCEGNPPQCSGGDMPGDSGPPIMNVFNETEFTLGGWDARKAGLGGWTLSPHHQYDPISKTIYRGDGTRQQGQSVSRTIRRIAGGGAATGDPAVGEDDYDAEHVDLGQPAAVTVGPDGSVYTADLLKDIVRRVAPDGTISRYAGVSGSAGYNDDDDPSNGLLDATAAWLDTPSDLAVGADGSLYIVDTLNHRIRRVRPDGKIETVAGGGVASSGPVMSATDLSLYLPWAVEVAADGTLYIGDNAGQIWRVAPGGRTALYATVPSSSVRDLAVAGDGRLYAIARHASWLGSLYEIGTDGRAREVSAHAGSVSPQDRETRDTAPLNEAKVDLVNVALTLDGTPYVTDQMNHRVWRVEADGAGQLVRVAGDTPPDLNGGPRDGGAARDAALGTPQGLAFGPDGGMFLADASFDTIRRVGDTLPGFDDDEIRIPSEDGAEVYAFDGTGRHLGTYDTTTGSKALTFAYSGSDGSGPLTSITDADGNTVTIERDTAGVPTALVADHGQRTELVVAANGWLSSLTDPAGRATTMTYERDGLLSSFELPGGRRSTFGWDAEGRLLRDDNADLGFQTLTRTADDSGSEVAVATKEGRVRSIRTERPDQETTVRTATDAAGLVTSTTKTDSGSTTDTPGGTTITTKLSADPQFHAFDSAVAPHVSALEVRRPSQEATGEVSRTTTSRSATLDDPDDPLTLDTLEVTSRTGTRLSRATYDADLRTSVAESPAGRRTTSRFGEKGRVIAFEAPDVVDTHYTYDLKGRPSTVVQGDRASTTTYDPATGWVASVTDSLGRTTTYDRDALGRVTAVHLPGGRTVGYDYDAAGNLRQIVPASRPAHGFTHSLTGLRNSWAPPTASPAGATTYGYDGDQQLETITRPDGRVATVETDTAGRPHRITHSGDTSTLTYDATSGTLDSLVSTDGHGLAWDYDGTLVTGETATGPVAGRVTQAFDVDGRLTSSTVDGTPAVPYEVDLDDLLTKAGDLTIARDTESGAVTGTTLGLATTAVTYDLYGGVQSRTYRHDGTDRFSETLQRDVAGRVAVEDETLAGSAARRLEYVYDAAGRLDQVKRDGVVVAEYDYDLNGNRTSEIVGSTTTTSTFDDQDRLLTRGAIEYRYTASGDLREKVDGTSSTTYSYDTIGNLKTVGLSDGRQVRYLVDPLGRRTAREIDGQRTHGWLYGEAAGPSAELHADGTIRSRFVYGTSMTVPAYMVRGGNTYRFVTDRLGSPRLIVDVTTGAVEQELDYDVWGDVVKDTNPGFQPFGFTGGLYDHATGLVRLGARDYDSETGRWTSQDPIDFGGGDPNLYGYVANDPVNWVDPSGLLGWPSLEDVSNAAAGFGDRVTTTARDINHMVNPASRMLPIPTTVDIREMLGSNGEVDACSWSYFTGERLGDGATALFGGAAARAAGYGLQARWWLPNAKGAEVSLTHNGERVIAAGWHRFKLHGRTVHRPHYHRRIRNPDGTTAPGGSWTNHRPWQPGK